MTESVRGSLTCAFLLAAIFLGGASGAGVIANAALQLLALVLILVLLWSKDRPALREGRWPTLIVALFTLVVLLSLIPLPASIWQSLPGREGVQRGFELLGMPNPTLPLSLAGERTLWSLASLLPPTAMFLMTLSLSAHWRRRLAWILLAGAVLSIVLSAFQMIGGSSSPLRFYEITNPNRAVGFFSDANHLPTLILMAMPLLGVIGAKAVKSRDAQRKSGGLTMAISTGLFLIIGIALSGSMAGYAMLLPVALATFLLFQRAVAGKVKAGLAVGVGALTIACLGVAATGPLNQDAFAAKFSSHSTSRATIWKNTVRAIGDYAPVGSGLGSFPLLYRTYDDQNRATGEFVNHAHNDYLELVLELGVAGALIIAAFLAWWLRRLVYAWTNEFSGASLARMGSIIVGVALVHSGVEYPLRSAALACVFALGSAFLVPAPSRRRIAPAEQEPEAGSKPRHLVVD
jgi:O-antigen ligase